MGPGGGGASTKSRCHTTAARQRTGSRLLVCFLCLVLLNTAPEHVRTRPLGACYVMTGCGSLCWTGDFVTPRVLHQLSLSTNPICLQPTSYRSTK